MAVLENEKLSTFSMSDYTQKGNKTSINPEALLESKFLAFPGFQTANAHLVTLYRGTRLLFIQELFPKKSGHSLRCNIPALFCKGHIKLLNEDHDFSANDWFSN